MEAHCQAHITNQLYSLIIWFLKILLREFKNHLHVLYVKKWLITQFSLKCAFIDFVQIVSKRIIGKVKKNVHFVVSLFKIGDNLDLIKI